MAAARASMELLQRRVSELSTCPICFEDFQNAKVLPCLHTFCLQCLRDYWKDKAGGQRVPCPVCRQPFTIPQSGLDALPNNFLLQSLMEVGRASIDSSGGSPCYEHPDKRLERYCIECRVMICRKCQAAKHEDHECKEVEVVAELFAKSLEEATNPVLLRIEQFRAALARRETEDWQIQVSTKAKEHAEKIRKTVDHQLGELKNELREIKISEKEDAISRKAALELAVSEMETFTRSSEELRTKGSPCDIICRADDLEARAGQLLQTYVLSGDQVAPVVTFIPMNIDELTRGGQNLVGCIRRLSSLHVLDDTMNELHPQTDRERQLEQQLIGTVQRLHSLTAKSMNNMKKLEEECRQATEKLEHSQDQCLVNGQRTEEVLRDAEKAKQQLLELEQLRETEQAIFDEYQEACERLLRRELAKDLIDGRGTAMMSQETSSAEVEKLSVDSHERIIAYIDIKHDRTPFRYPYAEKQCRTLDSEVRSALIRQDKLDDELTKSDKRREKWERDYSQSFEELQTFDMEVVLSVERQRRLQGHIIDNETKVEKATEANRANSAIQNELHLAEHQAKVFQQELDMSSERTRKLRQEMLQVDERQQWLGQMKSACDDDGSARELFQQTFSENVFLEKRLQQVLKSEENLSKRLLQAKENVTVSRRELEIASDSMMNLQGKRVSDWKGPKQADQTLLNETELLELLNEAIEREKRVFQETVLTLSNEKELRMKLRRLLDSERIFETPVRQLKYCKSVAEEIKVLDYNRDTCGVTTLGEELCVLCSEGYNTRVVVYSTNDFAFLHEFSLPRLSRDDITDFTSCKGFRDPCLLIADSKGRCLHKITRNGKNWPATRWPLSHKPCGVSEMSYKFNERVIVACCKDGLLSNTGKLIELNNQGVSICEIILRPMITSLWNVRALETGGYLISYRGFWCPRGERVSTVDDNGKVTQSYGDGWLSSESDLLRAACHMAVDGDGFVFVADTENHRIVLLNPSLQFVRIIATKRWPRWLHFDRKSRRLFVVHGNTCEVSVLQL